MGEKAGHPFRGNQHGKGGGKGGGGGVSGVEKHELDKIRKGDQGPGRGRITKEEFNRIADAADREAGIQRTIKADREAEFGKPKSAAAEARAQAKFAAKVPAKDKLPGGAFHGMTKDTDTPAILKRAEQLRTGEGLKGMDKWGLKPDLALARARSEIGMGRLASGLKREMAKPEVRAKVNEKLRSDKKSGYVAKSVENLMKRSGGSEEVANRRLKTAAKLRAMRAAARGGFSN